VTSTTSRTTSRARVLLVVAGLVAPLSFGVASGAVGAAAATVPSRVQPADHAAAGQREPAQRYVTANVNKKEVKKGKKVTISGAIEAPDAPGCSAGVALAVERSTTGAVYKVVGSVTTDGGGSYSVKAVVPKKARFRISAPATDACVAAQSPPRTVNVLPTR
jgi:hypothetical protein